MSCLAKRLAILFLMLAIMIILIVGVFANIWWFTIIKRMIFGGLAFMIFGLVIGEYLNYNIKQVKKSKNIKNESNSSVENKQETNNLSKEDNNKEQKSDKMTSLNFEKIDSDEDNIINQNLDNIDSLSDIEDISELGEEVDSKKVTDILRNMKENN